MRPLRSHLLAAAICSLALCSCGSKPERVAGCLARVGDEVYTVDDLRAAMPAGLSPDDSARYASALIREWAETRVLDAAARRNITDMERIDKLVEQYRTDLVLHEYRRRMFEQNADKVFHPDTIAAYYQDHASDFKLQRPVVKGIYLKVPSDARDVQKMDRWSRSAATSDLDHLEQAASRQATHYDYFRDHWVDWEQIENRIPYDFGADPTAFLRSNKHLKADIDGFTYILDITDYIPAGKPMPLEFASPGIKEVLLNIRRAAFDATLKRQMLDKGVEDGTVVFYQ